MPNAPTTITATVVKILASRDGWHLTLLDVPTEPSGKKVRATGVWSPVEGESYDLVVRESHHPKHGPGLAIDHATIALDASTAGGLARTLTRLVRGVGPVRAAGIADAAIRRVVGEPAGQQLTAEVADEVLTQLIEDPSIAGGVKGVSAETAAALSTRLAETRDDRRVYLELYSMLPTAPLHLIRSAVAEWGRSGPERITTDPYALLQLDRVGWQTADTVARADCDVAVYDSRRVVAACRAAVGEVCEQTGHTLATRGEYLSCVSKLLGPGVEADEDAISAANVEPIVIDGREYYCPHDLHADEQAIGTYLRTYAEQRMPPLPVDTTGASAEQDAALRLLASARVACLVGGAGVGKTWCMRALALAAERMYGRDAVHLAAPTGMAARVLSDATGFHARTLHSHLARLHQGEVLPAGVWIVDETSMVDVPLMGRLVRRLPETHRLLLVGDDGQLPSVGPGAVLRDAQRIVPTARLVEVRRNAGWIAHGSAAMREGRLPVDWLDDPREIADERNLAIVLAESPMEWVRDELPGVLAALGADQHSSQVMASQWRGDEGVSAAAALLAERYTGNAEWACEGMGLRVGDRIVVGKNGIYGGVPLVNGDQCVVLGTSDDGKVLLAPDAAGAGSATVALSLKELHKARVRLAYALTVHKLQGSGVDYAICLLPRAHTYSLTRELIYTAVTRARKGAILVGEPEVIERGLRRRAANRTTLLSLGG